MFLNIDSPGGFWGEVQIYRNRTVTANGETVVDESMDLDTCNARYFRNASRDDLPGIDTFAEYVEKMFDQKQFEVDVTDGSLELGFISKVARPDPVFRLYLCIDLTICIQITAQPVDACDPGIGVLKIGEKRLQGFGITFLQSCLDLSEQPLDSGDRKRLFTVQRPHMTEHLRSQPGKFRNMLGNGAK